MKRPNKGYRLVGGGWRALNVVAGLIMAVGMLTGCGVQEAASTPSPSTPTVTVPQAPATPTDAAQAAPTKAVVGPDSFQNPVFRQDFPDPSMIKVGDTYYAYATNGSGRNVQLATSHDLVTWELLGDALPGTGPWAKLGGSHIWAPEVIKLGDKYVMYYTARDKTADKQCIGVATGDKPDGPFKDASDHALVCQENEGGSIDPDPFRDGDKLYLYWKNDGNCCGDTTYLYVQELAPDGLSLVGQPTRLVSNDKRWEGLVVEAPTMWKQDGKYYLFYSGNNYAGVEYAVGYANCQAATGPCEDAPENPILATSLNKPPVIGPGHQTVILDQHGQTWMVYHAWEVASTGTKTSRRLVWLDRLIWQDGKPHVQGPTTGPQPKP